LRDAVIDSRKVPYVELSTVDTSVNARILGFELRQELKDPRALGFLEFHDPTGEIANLLDAGTDIQVRGGRRGGLSYPLLTGIVTRSPVRDPTPARKLHVPIADGWAKADRGLSLFTGLSLPVTPQVLLGNAMQVAGVQAGRLSARGFPERRTPAANWKFGKAVKEIGVMWGLDNTDQEQNRLDKQSGSMSEDFDWVTGFDADGVFFWEAWSEGPLAATPAVEFTADDLIAFGREEPEPVEGLQPTEREARRLARQAKASFEVFFDPTLVPGKRVTLIGEDYRIVRRRHYYDGQRFRTEASCGAIPA
jgi:hypothetical protein